EEPPLDEAAMHAEESSRVENAAIVLQRNFRKSRERKVEREKKEIEGKKKHEAATKIQKQFRLYTEQKKNLKEEEALQKVREDLFGERLQNGEEHIEEELQRQGEEEERRQREKEEKI